MQNLWCPTCEDEFHAGPTEPWRCPNDHPLAFRDPTQPTGPAPTITHRHVQCGIWAFDDLLPVEQRVTLGEGWTPLVEAPNHDAVYKLEYLSPTQSFKDRGAAVTISRAIGIGVNHVLEDSSGNAGAAIAAYAARAGLDASIYVPDEIAAEKHDRIERTGAEVIPVPGDRSAATEVCQAAVDDGGGWYASHAWNPAFYAGTATFAYELAAQRNWDAPDAIVLPVGHGTLFLGIAHGFQNLVAADWIDTMPRLFAVQAAGTAPIVERLHSPEVAAGTNTVADGVQIQSPVKEDAIVEAITATNGDAIAVGTDETEDTRRRLQSQGFGVEPTAALAPAGLHVYREQRGLAADTDVVVPLTGAGTH